MNTANMPHVFHIPAGHNTGERGVLCTCGSALRLHGAVNGLLMLAPPNATTTAQCSLCGAARSRWSTPMAVPNSWAGSR